MDRPGNAEVELNCGLDFVTNVTLVTLVWARAKPLFSMSGIACYFSE